MKIVCHVRLYFYFQQVGFTPFLVATPLGNTLKTCVLRNEVNGPELAYHEILIKSGNKVQSLLPLGEGNLFGGHSQVTISRSFFLELVKIILEIVNLDSVLFSLVIQDLKRKDRVSFTNSNKIVNHVKLTGRIQKSQKSPSFLPIAR